jgi:HD-GYP domain-containing protein (c-di-GMP phosphodiesterase class II)/DNA-binding NarL/FixJ family response regulator
LRYYQAAVLERLVSLAAQTLGGDASAILAAADGRSAGAMAVAAVHGADTELVGRRCSVESGLAGRVLSSGAPMVATRGRELGQALGLMTPASTTATAAAPIIAGGPAGVLAVSTTRSDGGFGENDLGLLADFAELCALALGHHRRRAEVAGTAEVQVRALETALGVWDGYTAEHSQAVVRLAIRVGQRLGMTALDLVELDLAARLHDVGKIRVPGDILRKPGPLSAEERHVIEFHPVWGRELAARIPGLQAVGAIIGFHHERPDGGGYPHGLRGDRIPLASHIVAACDAYGAMTEDRPYRPALSARQALGELRATAGRQFHPDVVESLVHEVAARPMTSRAAGEKNPLNVVLVDDHVALRRGMELLLRRAGLDIVGTADDADTGEALILHRKPDVAVVDLALPGRSGAELTRSLLRTNPDLRIILYTGAADERQLLDALDAGAAGFALKGGDPEELDEAIRTVAAGGDYLDPRLTPLLAGRGSGRRKTLSPREREIMALLARGLSGEDAAKHLSLSPETVRSHVRNAMQKLGATTRAHAVAVALQRGEISA